MFVQLNPPLPVYVNSKGSGLAHGVIDYGPEANLVFMVIMDDTGEIWCIPNAEVRGRKNYTMGRLIS